MRLESALKGGGGGDDLPGWLTEATELHQIIRLTGWTPEQIEDQPAALLDALRAVDNVYRKVEAEASSGQFG